MVERTSIWCDCVNISCSINPSKINKLSLSYSRNIRNMSKLIFVSLESLNHPWSVCNNAGVWKFKFGIWPRLKEEWNRIAFFSYVTNSVAGGLEFPLSYSRERRSPMFTMREPGHGATLIHVPSSRRISRPGILKVTSRVTNTVSLCSSHVNVDSCVGWYVG